jgi:isopentenyl-diphosphate Delta-isomerase
VAAAAPQTSTTVVSSEEDRLILVDGDDRPVGELDKAACHDGDGVRHRAFSVFLIDRQGRLLLQRRADSKRLWPNYWSNSCCSHPRAGEILERAVSRRVKEELGIVAAAEFIYRFEYQARYGTLGSEHEVCSVYLGQAFADPAVNTTEISDWRWISANELDTALTTDPSSFTPWFLMEWATLRTHHADRLARYGVPLPLRTSET